MFVPVSNEASMWVSEQFVNSAGLIYGYFTDGYSVRGQEVLHFRSGVTDQVHQLTKIVLFYLNHCGIPRSLNQKCKMTVVQISHGQGAL